MIKLSKNSNGFTAIEGVLVLLVLVLIGVVGYIAYKSHHKTTTSISKSSNSTDNVYTASQWLPYTSATGSFSASFPTSPNFPKTPAAPNPISKTIGDVNVVLSSVVSSNNTNTTYTISSLTYPNNVTLPNIDSSFSDYQNKHIISSKSITIGGKNAETYELTATRKAQTVNLQGHQSTTPATPINDVGEFIADGKVLYELDAVHNGNTSAVNAQYFLNSFKLND